MEVSACAEIIRLLFCACPLAPRSARGMYLMCGSRLSAAVAGMLATVLQKFAMSEARDGIRLELA